MLAVVCDRLQLFPEFQSGMAERGEREKKKGGLGTVLGECGAFPVWWTWGRSVLPQRGNGAEGAEMKLVFGARLPPG